MRRREFISLIGGVSVARPFAARAQPTKIPRIGVLSPSRSEDASPNRVTLQAFVTGMRELGYVDGSSVVLEHRFPNEQPDQFRKMAAELVALQPDVLIGIGANASPFIKQVINSISCQGCDPHNPDRFLYWY